MSVRLFRDVDLYHAIVERVAHGEDYYAAAAAEHRAHGYPTAPAAVFRQPWLAWILAVLRFDWLRSLALFPLVASIAILFYRSLLRTGLSPAQRVGCFAIFASGLGIGVMRGAAYQHESWAGLLIALSLLLYRPGRWGASVCLGLAACFFRELALPYLMAMALFALLERSWRELAAWTVSAVLFCVIFAVHISRAAALLPGRRLCVGCLSGCILPDCHLHC